MSESLGPADYIDNLKVEYKFTLQNEKNRELKPKYIMY